MRCPECDYPLWNLKARECPECGRAFRPSEFEFVVDSVRFCCPHCDQSYFGTGDRGQLVPSSFDCVGCSQSLTMDEMVLRPAEGVHEQQTQVEHLPWLERHRRGFVKSWLRTIGRGLIAPHRLARGLPEEPRAGQAWWYLLFTWTVFAACGASFPLLVLALIEAISGGPEAVTVLLVGLGLAVGGGLVMMAYAGLWALSAHWLLRLTGGGTGPLGRTVESICYSCGAGAVFVVPCLGPYCGSSVGGVWWAVSAILMLTIAHKVHGGRASFAVLTFPAVLVGLFMAGYFALFLYVIPSASTAMVQAASTVQVQSQVQTVTDAVLAYAAEHEGRGPRHAVAMLGEDVVGAEFILASSATMIDQVPAGAGNLLELEGMRPRPRAERVREIVDAMPAGVVAHRFGDFVFTYHGIDLDAADPGLWIVVSCPDPDAGVVNALRVDAIGMADGSIRMITPDTFATGLAEQNALRADLGLPPIPDPATVTH